MSLFLKLCLGHLLGDFVLQPAALVKAKRETLPGLLLHVAIIGLTSAIVTVDNIRTNWPAVVLVTAAHLLIERLTIEAYVNTRTRGLFVLLFDQALHILSIALVVWLAGAWSLKATTVLWGFQVPVGRLAALCAVLMVMLFGSILGFETVNAFTDPVAGKQRLLSWDLPRFLGMAERGIALALALAVFPALLVVPFLPRAAFALTRDPRERARQMVEVASGLASCLIGYAIVAAVVLITTQSFIRY